MRRLISIMHRETLLLPLLSSAELRVAFRNIIFYILAYLFCIESNFKYMQIYNCQTTSIRSTQLECKDHSHGVQNICMETKQV